MPTERTTSTRGNWFKSALASAILLVVPAAAQAQDIPDYMKITAVNTSPPPAKSKVAFGDIYALNDGMFTIYDKSLKLFQENFRSRHNIILALFSGKGGRFILYRPGQPPLEAESPPAVYQMSKAVGHCAMATYDLVAPYCTSATTDLRWKGEMEAYRTRVKTALAALPDADLTTDDRALFKDALMQILAFQDKCLSPGAFTFADVEAYCHGIKPDLAKCITVSANAQVGHWYKVLENWKQLIGKDWDDTYGLSNSIYVARQNNILFSTMVQFFGEKAINDRLLLMETTDFTATPEDLLQGFTRIMGDRALGKVFYGDYHMMDYELLGGGGRTAIAAEAAKRGTKALLPPLVPYNSTAWPWKTDPATGSGAALMEDIH